MEPKGEKPGPFSSPLEPDRPGEPGLMKPAPVLGAGFLKPNGEKPEPFSSALGLAGPALEPNPPVLGADLLEPKGEKPEFLSLPDAVDRPGELEPG